MGNSVLCLEWGPVFTGTLNSIIEASSRVRDWNADRKHLKSSGKEGASCSPETKRASTTLL